jgi:hypothetical protein
MADIARRSPDKRCPASIHSGGSIWAVAQVVACGAHPRHRPRWKTAATGHPDRPCGLACAAADNERNNRR